MNVERIDFDVQADPTLTVAVSRTQNSAAVKDAAAKPEEKSQNDSVSATPEDVDKALKSIETVANALNTHLRFLKDDSTGDTVIRIVDDDTGETVRQIPAEDILRIKSRMRETVGLLFDQEV